MEAKETSAVLYHFSVLACENSAVFSTGQREFEPKEAALQEAAQFLCDYCLVLLRLGLRLVTCARDAGEMVFFTPS